MFTSIRYLTYNNIHKYNSYQLYDTCFATIIHSPNQSPRVVDTSNTITLYSLINYYESINRNVALNIAGYYNWLDDKFFITEKFINNQLSLLDENLDTKYKIKYYCSVLRYLKDRFKIEINKR